MLNGKAARGLEVGSWRLDIRGWKIEDGIIEERISKKGQNKPEL
jgi:hypothetical protein